ncbi:crocetin glucosyltransferase 3-like [Phoenix dactylifera]|uniref:Glycosyltransferase n=1 Tax=Phoenix dactylifera TaxID=42345 RepID=A0A8B7D4K0_PHODC|nr:crocetin glucosyltransferase 3-like [Phoenix dactylifera]
MEYTLMNGYAALTHKTLILSVMSVKFPGRRLRCFPPQLFVSRASTMAAKGNIVLFPFLAQGHMNPCLDLARLLAARHPGLTLTLVTTTGNLPHLRRLFPHDLFPSLRLAAIPFRPSDHGLPPDADTTFALPAHLVTPFNHATYSLQPHFHRLLSDLSAAGAGGADPPLLCVIADMFLPWTVPVAQSLGVFHAVLYTSGPFAMSIYNYIWSYLPHAASDADEFAVPDLPGVAVRRSQLSRNMLSAASPDHSTAVFVRRQADLCRGSGAALWNTADALEKPFLDAWASSSGLPVFAVGPLFAAAPKPPAGRGVKDGGAADPAAGCRAWLDRHPRGSVAYVSFGSQNRLPAGEAAALAAALEGQGRPFLWAAPAADQAPEGVVGEGVGLVVRGWVPQIEILAHAATGAFVSHCGWNSLLESMRHGVPVIAWPLGGEQFCNAKLMKEELGVCMEVGSAAEAAAAVAEVMGEGERGREIRRRAREVAAELEAAVSESGGVKGASLRALDEFLEVVGAQTLRLR